MVKFIAKTGFDTVYGARPLRRAIQSNVEDKFAEKMLDGEINAKDNVIVKYSDGEVKIEKVANK